MTRLGPLTVQALGRSPYDDVVQGTGVEDPNEPQRLFDDRGRAYNPESRRLNRDIIRAHNEVMSVIGVAEPENCAPNQKAKALREYHEHQDFWGWTLFRTGKSLVSAVAWGLNGTRQRILLYREYAHVPGMDLIQYETQRFGLSLLGRGLPAFIVDQSIIYLYSNRPNMIWARLGPRHVAWLETAFGFLLSYNRVYMTMQRLGLFPAWQFFPTIEFYIPFTSVSPIAPVSPPESLTLWAISNWAGRIGLAILPMAVYIFHEQFTEVLNAVLQKAIYDILPRPIEYPASNKSEHHRPTSHDPDFAVVHDSRHPTRLSTGNGGPRQQEDHEIYEDTTANDEEEVPHPNQENYPPEEPLHDIVRQQSRLSARTADEYITDEEDAGDVVGTTLISFDVENETDTPPATWSAAELRAHHSSLASESADKHTRRYRITPLTLMPARLVSYIYANISSRMIAVPFEILWMRLMARSYRTRFGLPTVDMYNIGLLSDFTFRMNVQWNLIEELNLFSSTAIACALIAIAYFKNVSEETWLKNHEDKNSEIE